jgi:hypothetical protein
MHIAKKVQEKRLTTSETLELKEEVELDAAKMAKAIEPQVKKAVDWLRKQQQAGGDWGTAPTIEDDRTRANVTGLCVRALLATGAKADDPAIDRAIRLLRNQPAAATPCAIDHQLTAFIYRALATATPFADLDLATRREEMRKSIPKQDLDFLRTLANALLGRREAKSATWAAIDKAATNILTTRHALEALSLAAQAGIDSPVDVWSRITDLLVSTQAERGAEIELAYDGVDFPETDGAKKVRPATWRFAIADADQKDADGNALTTLAAAEILKLAQIELTRLGALKDAQRRQIDRAQRGALAWLQARRTWRTPPPTEAEWSIRKWEYVHALARVFSLYGAKNIDGVDWHVEGAYHLMREQYNNGRWDTGYGNAVAETAHAVLFLVRGVLRPSATR